LGNLLVENFLEIKTIEILGLEDNFKLVKFLKKVILLKNLVKLRIKVNKATPKTYEALKFFITKKESIEEIDIGEFYLSYPIKTLIL